MPIRNRLDILATGIKTPVGIKPFGPDLATLERIGKEIEGLLPAATDQLMACTSHTLLEPGGLQMVSMTAVQTPQFCPMCGFMSGWGWIGMLLMGLFWIAVIAAVVWVVLRLMDRRGGGG